MSGILTEVFVQSNTLEGVCQGTPWAPSPPLAGGGGASIPVRHVPEGATDDEYGLDNLVDMARETNSLALHCLADLMEHAGQEYISAMNRLMFDVLMQDDPPTPAIPSKVAYTPAVTLQELEAALVG